MNGENEAHMEPEVRPEPLYASFVAIRNTELTVYWARNNILSAINFALLAVAFAGRSDSFVILHSALVGVGGIVLAVIWLLFVHKGKQLLTDRWELALKIYETTIQQSDHRLFTNVHAKAENNPLEG